MLLEIENITKEYHVGNGAVRALDDVSLSVDRGEFVAVQGPSGCGKTTLLMVCGGLLAPDRGQVRLDGTSPYDLPADERARFRATEIGFVFQQFHLVPYLSVLDNVLAASIAVERSGARDRARELIAHFGLDSRIRHVPAQLSTGERQRTAMARALLNRPKLLLADEPTGNLDDKNGEAVLGHLIEFAREAAVLLVTHDSRAVEYAQRVTHIQNGRFLAEPPAQPEAAPRTESGR